MSDGSIWLKTANIPQYAPLTGEVQADVAVVGGGMAGLCAAYELMKRGLRVAVLERARIGRGNTGGTTGKLTLQHGLCYRRMLDEYDRRAAGLYARANGLALERLKEIISENRMECDYVEADAHIYAENATELRDLEKELAVAKLLGLPMSITHPDELPFPILGALTLPGQGAFHPVKFLSALSERIVEGGGQIFEETPVLDVEEDGQIHTRTGRIQADVVMIATHYPILQSHGKYFMKLYQSREAGVAFRWRPIRGLYLSAAQNGWSVRSYGDYAIMVGADSKTGQEGDESRFEEAGKAAKRLFGASEIAYRWAAQDCMSYDHLPYVGRYGGHTNRLYVASGFAKWGMTGSMAAAMLLSDLITGKKNELAGLFDPPRANPAVAAKEFIPQAGKMVSGLAKGYLKLAPDELSDLKKGQAVIIHRDGWRLGVFRDQEDGLHLVDTVCTHMGCGVEWNADEQSWDCPCHGSRFGIDGEVLNAPAVKGLETPGDGE